MPGKPRDILPEEARLKGVSTHHSEMPNGELRFRLQHIDGTAYSRTEATESGGWQQSHIHNSVRETYIVQSGRIALAELIGEKLKLRIFGPDEICTTEPFAPHNVYLFGASVIHTIKHGVGTLADWHADPVLDGQTLHLGETDIERMATLT